MASLVGRLKKGGNRKGEKAHSNGSKAESLATAGFASRNAVLASPSPSVLPKIGSLALDRPSSRASSLRSNATLKPGSGLKPLQYERDLQADSLAWAEHRPSTGDSPPLESQDGLVSESEDEGFYDATEGGTSASDADNTEDEAGEEEDSLATLAAQMRALEAHDKELQAQLAMSAPATTPHQVMPATMASSSDLDYDTSTDTEYETDNETLDRPDSPLDDAFEEADQPAGFVARLSPVSRRSQSPNDSRSPAVDNSSRTATPTRPPRRDPRAANGRTRVVKREKHDPLALHTAIQGEVSPSQSYRFDIRPKNPFRLVSNAQAPPAIKSPEHGPADILFDIEAHSETSLATGGLEQLEEKTPPGPELAEETDHTEKAPAVLSSGNIRRVAPPALTEELLRLEAEEKQTLALQNLNNPYPGLQLIGNTPAHVLQTSPAQSSLSSGDPKLTSKSSDPDTAILGSSALRDQTPTRDTGLLASLQSFGRAATQGGLRPVTFRPSPKNVSENTTIPKPYMPQYPDLSEPVSLAQPVSPARAAKRVQLGGVSDREATAHVNFADGQDSLISISQKETLATANARKRSAAEPPSWLDQQIRSEVKTHSTPPLTALVEENVRVPLQPLPSAFTQADNGARAILPKSGSNLSRSTIGRKVSDFNGDANPKQTSLTVRAAQVKAAEQSMAREAATPSITSTGSSFLTTLMRMTDKLSGISPDLNNYDQPIFVRHVAINPYTATPGERRAGIQRPHEVTPKALPPDLTPLSAAKSMSAATSTIRRDALRAPEVRSFAHT